MSDSRQVMSNCMALLIPIEYSTKIKQILIDKNVYQSKFMPRKIGHHLALPIDGKFDTLSEEIYSIIPNLVGEITFEENVLEINTPNLTPGQLMSKKIFGWLEGLSYDFNMDLLIDRIPLKWELLGDLALLPSNSFTQKEWVKLFSECQDS